MDLLKIIRSIEEILYEIMTWVVFYPRTLGRAVTHPVEMMEYSDVEQTEAPEAQYSDALSPPLFLLLSILIAHGIEVVLRQETLLGGGLGTEIAKSHEYLLVLRAIAFSIFPMLFALAVLKSLGRKIDREHLRAPFFAQCYAAAPFALAIRLASIAIRAPVEPLKIAGLAAIPLIVTCYLWLQTRWLAAHVGATIPRSMLIAIWTFAKATVINLAIAYALL
jgi:hypothetical protein